MNKGLGYPTLLDGLKPAGPKSNVELRASAAGGFGPRDPLGRKNSATSTAQIGQVRPVAHPPERLRRWATGPAVRRTAKARPIELPHSTMFVLGHTLIKTVRRQRRRNEAQPSLRKCKYFSGSKPAGPKTSMASCGPPRSEASARAALRAAEAQPIRFRPQPAQNEILRPRRPVKDAVRPLRIRGLRADRYHGKLAVRSPPKPGKQLSPLHRQSQASCSAQRGSKTDYGFRA